MVNGVAVGGTTVGVAVFDGTMMGALVGARVGVDGT
jgi:hypothetical protein